LFGSNARLDHAIEPRAALDGKAIQEIVDRKVKEALEKAQGYNPKQIESSRMAKSLAKSSAFVRCLTPWFERVLKATHESAKAREQNG
jgi:hypothetical protein